MEHLCVPNGIIMCSERKKMSLVLKPHVTKMSECTYSRTRQGHNYRAVEAAPRHLRDTAGLHAAVKRKIHASAGNRTPLSQLVH
jgi:hypothetical protein